MAYERTRVFLGLDSHGKPIYSQVSGRTQDERNDNIVKRYIESGRIWELLPPNMVTDNSPKELAPELHPFTPYAENYYQRFKRSNRKKTHGTQMGWLKQACKFFGDEAIEHIGDERIQDYLNFIEISQTSGEKCTTEGIKQKLTFVGEIFNRAVKEGFIKSNPCKSDDLKLGGVKGKGIKPLPRETIMKLIDFIRATEDLQVKFWLALMLYTGLRREEMLGLRWEDINFEAGTLQIERAITYDSSLAEVGDTKNWSSVRVLFMPDELINTLKPYRQDSGFLVADENGEPLNDRGIKTLRKRVRDCTGLPKLDARELRHSYATMLCEARIDVKAIGTTMGHTKTSTTERYIGAPEASRMHSIRNAGINYILG